MPIVFIALGTNLGDRMANLEAAIEALAPFVRVLDLSPVYQTAPWGYIDQPWFLNRVMRGETGLPPQDLLAAMKAVETELGRKPTFRNGPRLIDLDLLFFDDLVLEADGLVIPHPRLAERAFVLIPLADIAPDLRHPVIGKTVKELLAGVDPEGVSPFDLQYDPVVQRLIDSPEPLIRHKALIKGAGLHPESPTVKKAREELHASPVLQALLAEQDSETGQILHHPYAKWRGAHWVLACLADLEVPKGVFKASPLMDQVFGWLLSAEHQQHIRILDGRVRRCASQEGNALYSFLELGLEDERSQVLAERLMSWQWPDGGWNCDKHPEAVNSSFMESLIPMRALARYGQRTGDSRARQAAERAAEIFLKRELFKRQRDGTVIKGDFTRLHYPAYWHYDILFALKVMAEAGFLGDPRCQPALELLESKRLPDGSFPAEGKFYHPPDGKTGESVVDWGGTSLKKGNEFVTVEALFVLRTANRFDPNGRRNDV